MSRPKDEYEGWIKATKKPVEIDAIRCIPENYAAIAEIPGVEHKNEDDVKFIIVTTVDGKKEGETNVRYGDWIIKGIKGEYYPCEHGVFEGSYDITDVGMRLT